MAIQDLRVIATIQTFNFCLSRFFYVRYASSLIKEGLSLLHKLTLILVTTFIVWFFFMWQSKAWFYGSSFKESIKGKICTKANLTALHEDTVIWKPKLIMISCNIILWLFLRNGLKIKKALQHKHYIFAICF